jgi:hypothetical protein
MEGMSPAVPIAGQAAATNPAAPANTLRRPVPCERLLFITISPGTHPRRHNLESLAILESFGD